MHPSRMAMLGPKASDPTKFQIPTPAAIHPDRLHMLGGSVSTTVRSSAALNTQPAFLSDAPKQSVQLTSARSFDEGPPTALPQSLATRGSVGRGRAPIPSRSSFRQPAQSRRAMPMQPSRSFSNAPGKWIRNAPSRSFNNAAAAQSFNGPPPKAFGDLPQARTSDNPPPPKKFDNPPPPRLFDSPRPPSSEPPSSSFNNAPAPRPPVAAASSSKSTSGIHPDRLKMLGIEPSLPVSLPNVSGARQSQQQHYSAERSAAVSSSSSVVPANPRHVPSVDDRHTVNPLIVANNTEAQPMMKPVQSTAPQKKISSVDVICYDDDRDYQNAVKQQQQHHHRDEASDLSSSLVSVQQRSAPAPSSSQQTSASLPIDGVQTTKLRQGLYGLAEHTGTTGSSLCDDGASRAARSANEESRRSQSQPLRSDAVKKQMKSIDPLKLKITAYYAGGETHREIHWEDKPASSISELFSKIEVSRPVQDEAVEKENAPAEITTHTDAFTTYRQKVEAGRAATHSILAAAKRSSSSKRDLEPTTNVPSSSNTAKTLSGPSPPPAPSTEASAAQPSVTKNSITSLSDSTPSKNRETRSVPTKSPRRSMQKTIGSSVEEIPQIYRDWNSRSGMGWVSDEDEEGPVATQMVIQQARMAANRIRSQ